MSSTLLATLGISAALLNLAGLVPYIRDIFAHKTKPERATWWVWLGLSVTALIAQFQAGATWSLVFACGNIIAIGLVAALSIRYGYGKFHRRDLISLVVAGAGIIISQYLRSPLFALLVVVIVDLIGFSLTIYKTWAAPHSETLISWIMSMTASMLATVSVGALDFAQLIYPLYLVLGDGLLVAIILLRRPRVALDEVDA